MTRTPTETAACAVASARRVLSSLVHAMALADSPATLDRLMDAHFAASRRLEQAQRSEP